jgi:hypothetical protein
MGGILIALFLAIGVLLGFVLIAAIDILKDEYKDQDYD